MECSRLPSTRSTAQEQKDEEAIAALEADPGKVEQLSIAGGVSAKFFEVEQTQVAQLRFRLMVRAEETEDKLSDRQTDSGAVSGASTPVHQIEVDVCPLQLDSPTDAVGGYDVFLNYRVLTDGDRSTAEKLYSLEPCRSRRSIQSFKGEVCITPSSPLLAFALFYTKRSLPSLSFPFSLSHTTPPFLPPPSLLSLSTVSLPHRPGISMGGPTAPLARTPSSMS